MAGACSCGEPPVVLKADANKEVDLPVGHILDILDGFLCFVAVGDECQFVGELRSDGLIDETEKRFRLGRHINIAVPYCRFIVNGHTAVIIERVSHQRHELPGERFQRGVIIGGIFQH